MANQTYQRVIATNSSVPEDESDESDERLDELKVSEYCIFLFALDTYMRYLEESSKIHVDENTAIENTVLRRGLALLRLADRDYLGYIEEELRKNITAKASLNLLRSALAQVPNARGASIRALKIRTVLTRGGPSTQKAVFGSSTKARREVREAIDAATTEDADQALAKLAMIDIRNSRLEHWIDLASDIAKPLVTPDISPVGEAVKRVGEATQALATDKLRQDSEEIPTKNTQLALESIQANAQEAASKSLRKTDEADRPVTKSEVVGIATAAAAALTTDPDDPKNVPESLRKLDSEQRAAALTDGRVLIAASAGSGKSSTLVSRVAYLVLDRKVPPSQILVTSFNKVAADELAGKIAKAIGTDLADQMTIGTTHSLCKHFVEEYGNKEEIAMMSRERGVGGGGSVAGSVQRAWAQCYPDDELPKCKDMMLLKTAWAGNGITPKQAKEQARDAKEMTAAKWYEFYEGFKGGIPGWRPPVPCKEFETFMARKRPGGVRLSDFDDMLGIYAQILQRDPKIRKTVQGLYSHILVDESQDLNAVQHQIFGMMSENVTDGKDGKSIWLCGDLNQCVSVDTPITLSDGTTKQAKDVQSGDLVLAYRNGALCPQTVQHVVPSSWDRGYRITTVSGRILTMSPNHKIWATDPVLEENRVLVYLMYRTGFGFRVGITNKHKPGYTYGQRPAQEQAERLWVLNVCSNREDALYAEEAYSLQYGIPTMVYEGAARGLNQERVNALFSKFGENGHQALKAKDLEFDLPHWFATVTTKESSRRLLVHLVGHGPRGSTVRMEWSGSDLDALLTQLGFVFRTGKKDSYRRLRKWFHNYRDALDFAQQLASAVQANIQERLVACDDRLNLLPAAGLLVGMSVLVQDGKKVRLDPIAKIEPVQGLFVDLDVDDASNFFGGGILSHNSIYSFRGAKPEQFLALHNGGDWKTKTIRTNYRCAPEIVEHANKLIAHNSERIEMEANPDARKAKNVASIRVTQPVDDAAAALATVREIKAKMGDGESVSDNAVLTRTNKELHNFETACIIKGVPYARKGASSFFGSPETSAVLGYVQLATGDDALKMQQALKDVINKPNRFFISPEAGTAAVDAALSMYAHRSGTDIKVLNPLVVLNNRDFQAILAQKLTGQTYGFKYGKAVEKLAEIGRELSSMRANAGSPAYTMRDMFSDILSLKGVAGRTDSSGKTVWGEQTFRESLQGDLKNAMGDDDNTTSEEEEEDSNPETMGLGNVGFLFELAKVDPDDPDDTLNDPATPMGFKAKMDRYQSKMKDLRVDITKWTKEQTALPPEQRKPPPGVLLSTAHGTKGSQWPNVYVSMPKGKFPFERKPKPGEHEPTPAEEQSRMEQERRLAYVAITRPAKNLTVICPSVVGGKTAGVSRFVGEAGLTLGENVPKMNANAVSKEAAVAHWHMPRGVEAEAMPSYRRG